MRLSLAYSPCPNDTYIFHALAQGLVSIPGVELDVSLGQAFSPDILSVPTAILAQGQEVVGRLDANYINARSLRKLLEGQMR